MREREFDEAEAINKATALFWRKGYSNTSVEELVMETGVSRYGLYGLYGDKHGLFIAALDHYCDRQVGDFLRNLEAPDARLAEVRKFFVVLAEFARLPAASKGCLVVNSAVEFGGGDKAIAERLARHFERVENAFCAALLRAKQAGELLPKAEPRALALYLSGIVQAALIQLRGGAEAAKIEVFLSTALSLLNHETNEGRGSETPARKD